MSFHTHNNWTWERQPDGSVVITAGTPRKQHKLSASEWASVVVAVSATPGIGSAYEAAFKIHNGEPAEG